MFKLPMVLAFTAMTAFFWGIYGIVLHTGTGLMGGHDSIQFAAKLGVSLRAFVGVGLAYFLIAVLVPVALLNRKRETGYWSVSGTVMSVFAGSVGALGALGVSLALAFGGQAIYVMPIVFGGAPVVNTLLTSWFNKSFNQIKPLFLVGMVLVALGMVGVLLTKPQGAAQDVEQTTNWLAVGMSIGLAVLCWGAYGPFLHLGQMKMGGSRLRPFCCVGIAYFVIAVAIPVLVLETLENLSTYTFEGMLWIAIASVLLRRHRLLRDRRGDSDIGVGVPGEPEHLHFRGDALVGIGGNGGSPRGVGDHHGIHVRRKTDFCHAAGLRVCAGHQHAGEHRQEPAL
jgi:hypothetical protein